MSGGFRYNIICIKSYRCVQCFGKVPVQIIEDFSSILKLCHVRRFRIVLRSTAHQLSELVDYLPTGFDPRIASSLLTLKSRDPPILRIRPPPHRARASFVLIEGHRTGAAGGIEQSKAGA